ncbi:hypothetical protein VTI28DRAFT_561 [Corynascus sepedonium]
MVSRREQKCSGDPHCIRIWGAAPPVSLFGTPRLSGLSQDLKILSLLHFAGEDSTSMRIAWPDARRVRSGWTYALLLCTFDAMQTDGRSCLGRKEIRVSQQQTAASITTNFGLPRWVAGCTPNLDFRSDCNRQRFGIQPKNCCHEVVGNASKRQLQEQMRPTAASGTARKWQQVGQTLG